MTPRVGIPIRRIPGWPVAAGLVVPPTLSVAAPVKDLFAQDVGVAGVLGELT